MEKEDPIESKFKSAFADYKKEPPASVWNNLSMELHPLSGTQSLWARIVSYLLSPEKHLGFYLALSGVTVSLFLTVFYFGSREHHTLRGHAYAGEARVRHGRAELFEVADKSIPWDSVKHSRSANIDNYGHFQFSQVEAGNYILRIAPDEISDISKRYMPSWFDKHESSDSCNLVTIGKQDVYVNAYLVKKVTSDE